MAASPRHKRTPCQYARQVSAPRLPQETLKVPSKLMVVHLRLAQRHRYRIPSCWCSTPVQQIAS
eukprot:2288715-Amphidinium_carterae.1